MQMNAPKQVMPAGQLPPVEQSSQHSLAPSAVMSSQVTGAVPPGDAGQLPAPAQSCVHTPTLGFITSSLRQTPSRPQVDGPPLRQSP